VPFIILCWGKEKNLHEKKIDLFLRKEEVYLLAEKGKRHQRKGAGRPPHSLNKKGKGMVSSAGRGEKEKKKKRGLRRKKLAFGERKKEGTGSPLLRRAKKGKGR